jgi:signal transduction histidine kinase
MGDQELLDRLAQNLVDNAIRYSPPEGGWARISVRATDRTATLAIENNGAIIPPEAVDALFEPFRRLTPHERMADPGGGSGLGLSIVRAITAAHRGTASAAARAGGGLMVTVRIPTCEPTD